MDRKKIIISFLIVTVGASVFFTSQQSLKKTTTIPTESIKEAKTYSITQKITYSEDKQVRDEIEVSKGDTALDALSKSKKVVSKTYSYGTLVEEIEGIKNGTDKKYWLYYVNGKEGKVGAADYKVAPGDVIEWKFKAYEQ